MDGKSREHDLLKVAASPVPGRDLAPKTVRGLLGVGVHLRLIDVHDIAPLDQGLAIDNLGIPGDSRLHVCTGTFKSWAAALQARSSGSLQVSTWAGLSMPRRRPCAAPS